LRITYVNGINTGFSVEKFLIFYVYNIIPYIDKMHFFLIYIDSNIYFTQCYDKSTSIATKHHFYLYQNNRTKSSTAGGRKVLAARRLKGRKKLSA